VPLTSIPDANLPDLLSLSALSLLPPWTWRFAVERLRAGEIPRIVLAEFAARRKGGQPNAATVGDRAAAAIRRAAVGGMRALTWSDPSYPAALAAIADPPFVLWTRGVVAVLERPAVAMVGSRAASPYGLAVAERLAADLVARGIVVVSGLARGVDSAAHRGALAGGGSTIAVLGSGADVIYPPEHASLARDIAATGLVMSELVPGTPPLKPFFPLRNRIISGLSRAVVVIEAGEKSGSLITARSALDQGRDVLAVPGNVLSGRNRGAHALLRDGAKIVEDADDILEELGLPEKGAVPLFPRGPVPDDPVLSSLTPGEPADLDAIAERSGIAPARLLPRLFELELQGFVARAGGGRFVRS
jgi:DNA processing protein